VFDIGWTELAVIACVAILVVGPKELPGMLRTIGKTVGQLRKMAGDFQKQFDEAIREAELDEVKKTMKAPFQPLEDARKAALDFQGSVNKSVTDLGKEAASGMPSGSVTGDAAPVTPPVPAAFTAPLPTPVMPSAETLPVPAAKAPAAKAKAPAKTSAKVPAKTAAKTQTPASTPVPAPKATGKAAAPRQAAPAKAVAKAAPATRKASAAKPKPGKKA
jgi:sec-independent protein translocase protein TatB